MFGTWQWAANTHDEVVREEKIFLLINIDERPMPLVHANAFGNIVRIGNITNIFSMARRPATRNEELLLFTYVAMICNIPWIQKYLPQVLIVPKRGLPMTEWRTICSDLPENVYILRQGSMWVSC